MKWLGYAACIRRRELHTEFWWRNLIERDHFEDLGIDRGIILNRGSKKLHGMWWSGLIWLSIAKSEGLERI